MTAEQATDAQQKVYAGLYEIPYLNAMPVEDTIALARYMVDVTSGFMKFAVQRPKTVGGSIEIATITKHEGFRWVRRKHFYPAALNAGGTVVQAPPRLRLPAQAVSLHDGVGSIRRGHRPINARSPAVPALQAL